MLQFVDFLETLSHSPCYIFANSTRQSRKSEVLIRSKLSLKPTAAGINEETHLACANLSTGMFSNHFPPTLAYQQQHLQFVQESLKIVVHILKINTKSK